MLSLLSAFVLSQAPQPTVAVVLSRRSAVPPARAAKLLTSLEGQLQKAAVVALSPAEVNSRLGKLSLKDATFCGGKRPCLAELGRQLPADVVVGLSLVFVKPDLSVAVTAVKAADGTVLAESSFVLPGKATEGSFDEFATALKVALAPPENPKRAERPPDAPVVEKPPPPSPSLTPQPTEAPVEAPSPTPAAHSSVPAMVTGGAAVAALAVGVGFMASALGKNASLTAGSTVLPDGRLQSPLSDAQAVAIRDAANAELGASIGFAAGAAALGVVSYLLWPRSP